MPSEARQKNVHCEAPCKLFALVLFNNHAPSNFETKRPPGQSDLGPCRPLKAME
jgi:hypothetical protein